VRIAEEIVTLVRCRWDNAPSLRHWWQEMNGADQSHVPLNSLYARMQDLGVPLDRVLLAIARSYGWLASSLIIVDDTSAQKFGVWMEGASSVRVANVKGSVLGHTVVTLMVAAPRGAMFLDYTIKVNPSRPRLARHAGRPSEEIRVLRRTKKWEMALALIEKAREEGLDQAWVLSSTARTSMPDRRFQRGGRTPRSPSSARQRVATGSSWTARR
jgi:hypothetical protein